LGRLARTHQGWHMGMTFEKFEKPAEYSALQKRLIKSFEYLLEDPRDIEHLTDRLNRIVTTLKKVKIPGNDYQKIWGFAFLLSHEMPEIMTHPNNTQLRELILECRNQMRQVIKSKLQSKVEHKTRRS